MKRIIFIICISFFPINIFGQESDSMSVKHFPRHYFSINPINCALLDQIGFSYEYKPGFLGFGLAVGYKYASERNYTRFFIAKSTEYGSYEFYSGLFVIPQVNIYFNKPKNQQKATLFYFSLKGIYKYLHVDSTDYHIWNLGQGDGDWYYRKQVDNANIAGIFWNLGVKHIYKHFFIDFNIGLGILIRDHKMVVAGEGINITNANISNVNPPRIDYYGERYWTVNISLNLGGDF
jgi:hypothetical protein